MNHLSAESVTIFRAHFDYAPPEKTMIKIYGFLSKLINLKHLILDSIIINYSDSIEGKYPNIFTKMHALVNVSIDAAVVPRSSTITRNYWETSGWIKTLIDNNSHLKDVRLTGFPDSETLAFHLSRA